jgi:DNA-binding winged helix-turn-helix (wHTH) protein
MQAFVDGHPGAGLAAYRFGGFRLDLLREQLSGPTGHCVLRRKVFATLRMLLETAPGLVTLDELLEHVWGRHAISASAVPNVIAELRRALGDDARAPRYIETRHRRGYRIIAAVSREGVAGPGVVVPMRRDGALLAALEGCAARDDGPPQARLRRLHRVACENGLAFLAIEVRLALQALAGDEARWARRALSA